MNPALLDTDVLPLYLKAGDHAVVHHGRQYIREHGSLNFSIITYYSINSANAVSDTPQRSATLFAAAAVSHL